MCDTLLCAESFCVPIDVLALASGVRLSGNGVTPLGPVSELCWAVPELHLLRKTLLSL